ncbi:MAG: hypothetical protein AAFY38_17280 [Pseudomonadota bacterium]
MDDETKTLLRTVLARLDGIEHRMDEADESHGRLLRKIDRLMDITLRSDATPADLSTRVARVERALRHLN